MSSTGDQRLHEAFDWLALAACLPLAIALIGIVLLLRFGPPTSYEQPTLLLGLNLTFITLISLVVCYRISRNFLFRPAPGLLFLGSGVLTWGVSGLVIILVCFQRTTGGLFDTNHLVTIHNTCIWLSSLLHLVGASLYQRWSGSLRSPRLWLAGAFLAVLALTSFIAVAALSNWFPIFFVPGAGGTPVRQYILGSAIVMFALSALIMQVRGRSQRRAFCRWYALALSLLGAGLAAVWLQKTNGSLLSWLGRTVQYLGGVYLIVVARLSKDAPGQDGTEEAPAGPEIWASVTLAVASVFSAVALRLLLLPAFGTTRPYITLFPAVTISAVAGGLWSGLLATALSTLFANYYLQEPVGQLTAMDSGSLVGMLLFVLNGVVVSFVCQARQRYQLRAVRAEHDARLAREREVVAEHLRLSRERFQALVTASSQVVYQMSPDWSEMLQLTSEQFLDATVEPSRDWLEKYIHPEDQPQVTATIREAIRSKSIFELEHRVLQADGTLGWTSSRAVPLFDENGEILVWFGAASDITERKRVESALRESEERFRKIFEEGPMGAMIVDLEYRFVKVNQRLCDMLGYTAEEFKSLGSADITHPEDLDLTRSRPKRLLNTPISQLGIEKRYLHKDGSIVWVNLTAWLMRNPQGEPLYFISTVEDVSEKRKLQERLLDAAKEEERARSSKTIQNYQQRLSQLTSKLSLAQEEERRRIAVELHDSIVQNLAFCKLKVGQIQLQQGVDGLQDVLDTIDRSIKASRSLCFELSPAVLFEVGLPAALQWLARQHASRNGLELTVSGSCQLDLPMESRILLFQAAREFLANVVKHSHASCAEISLSETKKSVILAVHDNGIGISRPREGAVPDASSGFGLFSLQEQLLNAGGSLTVGYTPGAGARVEAALPLKTRRSRSR